MNLLNCLLSSTLKVSRMLSSANQLLTFFSINKCLMSALSPAGSNKDPTNSKLLLKSGLTLFSGTKKNRKLSVRTLSSSERPYGSFTFARKRKTKFEHHLATE